MKRVEASLFLKIKLPAVYGFLALSVLLPGRGWGISINRTNTWNGGGGDSLWSNASNWDSGGPLAGDSLQFGGNGATTVNDLSDIHLSDILFSANAGGFSLSGNKVTFSGGSGFKRIENDSPSTQTIGFSGDLIGLQTVVAKAGTLVINSTVSTPGAGLTVGGGSTVIFNRSLLGMNFISVAENTTAQFNAAVSTSITFGHATVVISSATELPGAEISEYGVLKLASDVTLSGHLDLVNDGFVIQSTAPIIDTNGFDMTVTQGIKDGGPAVVPEPAKLIKRGAGTLTVDGDNRLDGWSGGTTILGGTLKAATANSFKSSSSFTLANAAGVVLDLNDNSYTLAELNGGGQAGGTVQLGAGSLTISSSTSSRFDGAIEGTGGLIKNGTGIFWLTGANSYTGTTTVNAGTLKGNARGLQGNIVNHSSVVFDQSEEGTYAGTLSGEGTLEKTGAGTLTLTQANTFTGETTLTAGSLSVGHSSALSTGNVTVNGGTLRGDGSPRQINVGSDYTQTAGRLELTLYGAGVGQQDSLQVGGTASLAGTLSVLVRPGFLPVGTSTYALVNASSISGTFDTPQSGAALRFELGYSSSAAQLTVLKTPYASYTQTANGQTVAAYMDGLYPTATGELALVLGELNALSATDLSDAVRSISPQSYQTLTTLGMSNLAGFSQRIFSQMARTRSGHRGILAATPDQTQSSVRWGALTAEAGTADSGWGEGMDDPFYVPEKKWGIFVTGDGMYASLPGDADVASGNLVSGGVTTGVDYRFSPRWSFGLGLGYALSNGDTGSGEMKIDGKNLTPALYGSFDADRFYVDGLLAFQNGSYTSKRTVVYGSQTKLAEANPTSRAYAAGVEAGLPIRRGSWDVVPLAGLQMSQETVDGFEETGAGAVSLAVGEEKQESLSSQMGVRVQKRLTNDSRDRFEVRSAWRHEYKGETTIDASFVGAGGRFSITGSDPQKDSLQVGGDVSGGFTENLSWVFSYDGDMGGVVAHRVHGGVRFQF